MPCVCCVCQESRDDIPTVSTGTELTSYADMYPVTHNGKPSGTVLAFICARCLRHANGMRVHVKSAINNVTVSRHAIERFLERQEGERISDESAVAAIIKIFSHAKQITFRDRFMAERLNNNGGKPADYLFHQGLIFVATRETPVTIMTIERQWHRRLGKDFWYKNPSIGVANAS